MLGIDSCDMKPSPPPPPPPPAALVAAEVAAAAGACAAAAAASTGTTSNTVVRGTYSGREAPRRTLGLVLLGSPCVANGQWVAIGQGRRMCARRLLLQQQTCASRTLKPT